ncbi:F-box domain, cyclin-like protein [Pochonia chlamydosporia 170]|uniref:F-box domain, cyclin-like protein n=1 Tax=Pochonia chlamydosporia 170 TaxID=1380566 RepID=A0A179FB17_METCM|nr:F-box domain, cyclin-like protein [Pochonia chlamydosporia 170]OAQ62481.1 F-box domain, cyclin-like protein [Pochonia chlamydosporia 170]
MPLSSLPRLSSDLLLSILDLLPFADLLSLSTVNKRIHALATLRLYSAVETTWALDRTPPVTLLLRSILNRPQLSGYVRSLRLVGNAFKDHPEIREPPASPLALFSISKGSRIIQSTGVPFAKHWIDELRSGTVDAVVAVLLLMLPNLTSLYLGPNFTVRNQILGKLLQYALWEPPEEYQLPILGNLQHVTFCRRTEEYRHLNARNTSDVLPFFYLSKIQSLSISIDNPVKFAWPAHTPAPLSLVSLEIYRLREARLKPLLSVLKGLQKLHWHCFYQPGLDRDVSKGIIELDTVAIALNQVCATLTDLTIEAECRPEISAGYYDPPPLEIRASLHGLAHLGKLRRLCAPWVFLMGFSESSAIKLQDLLSPSLELLTLTADLEDNEEWEWHDDSVVSAIKSELENHSLSSLTNLYCIVLPIPLGYGKMTAERKQELRDIGANAGLHLGWVDK